MTLASWIYDLPCVTCHIYYVGQTDRTLKQRYSVHIQYIRYNNPQSACVSHILRYTLKCGSIQNTVTLINRDTKGRLMGILEQLFIQKCSLEQTLIQEQIPGENISLFTVLYDVRLRHATD